MKTIDLFAGLGGLRIPFDEFGCQCVFSSEWDKFAQITYEANFGEKPHGDITEIDPKDIPDHDILLGGFPCVAFSSIGSRRGFQDTRGTLFFNIAAILKEKRPQAFLLENVKNLKSHDNGNTFTVIENTLKDLGYNVHTKILNALDFGLPQKRERTIIVGFLDKVDFKFPESFGSPPCLSTILETHADEGLIASNYIIQKRLDRLASQGSPPPFYPSIWHENKSGNISVLPYSVALRANASHNYILVNGVRHPSARELLRFQGYSDTYKIVLHLKHIRKQAGNSVPVPMIREVAKNIMKAINNEF